MTTMTVTEARAALPEVLDRVIDGDEVTITRHGKPVAVVVRAGAARSGRAAAAFAGAQQIQEMLEAARKKPLSPTGTISRERAEALVASIRADRDAR